MQYLIDTNCLIITKSIGVLVSNGSYGLYAPGPGPWVLAKQKIKTFKSGSNENECKRATMTSQATFVSCSYCHLIVCKST